MIRASTLVKTGFLCFLSVLVLSGLEWLGAGRFFGAAATAMVVITGVIIFIGSWANRFGLVKDDLERND